jgi:hypothetical protein
VLEKEYQYQIPKSDIPKHCSRVQGWLKRMECTPGPKKIRIEDLGITEFRRYLDIAGAAPELKSIPQNRWLDIIHLGVAAELLQDLVVQSHVWEALAEKAKHKNDIGKSVNRAVLEYVYQKTACGSGLRHSLVRIGIESLDFVRPLDGPLAFFHDMEREAWQDEVYETKRPEVSSQYIANKVLLVERMHDLEQFTEVGHDEAMRLESPKGSTPDKPTARETAQVEKPGLRGASPKKAESVRKSAPSSDPETPNLSTKPKSHFDALLADVAGGKALSNGRWLKAHSNSKLVPPKVSYASSPTQQTCLARSSNAGSHSNDRTIVHSVAVSPTLSFLPPEIPQFSLPSLSALPALNPPRLQSLTPPPLPSFVPSPIPPISSFVSSVKGSSSPDPAQAQSFRSSRKDRRALHSRIEAKWPPERLPTVPPSAEDLREAAGDVGQRNFATMDAGNDVSPKSI